MFVSLTPGLGRRGWAGSAPALSGLVPTQLTLMDLQVLLQRGAQWWDAGGIPGSHLSPEGPGHCPA